MFQKLLILAIATLSSFITAQDALRDIQAGMEGLKQVGKDPELLAQLMRDMQVSLDVLVSCPMVQVKYQ